MNFLKCFLAEYVKFRDDKKGIKCTLVIAHFDATIIIVILTKNTCASHAITEIYDKLNSMLTKVLELTNSITKQPLL